MAKKVELHQAFFFICPNCGAENYKRAMDPEMSDEEMEDIKQELGMPAWDADSGYFLLVPTEVKCKKCKRKFETEEEEEDLE